jgi:hypothetical protein
LVLTGQPNDFDKTFLDNPHTNLKCHKGKAGDKWEGGVGMATAPRAWSEQFIKLSKSELAIFKSSEAARPSHVIPTSSVFCVRPMRTEESPLYLLSPHCASSFAFIQLETFARVFYFMIREKQLIDWLNAFEKVLGGSGSIVHFSSSNELQAPETVAGSDEVMLYSFLP